jgi:hypothetical protein
MTRRRRGCLPLLILLLAALAGLGDHAEVDHLAGGECN